MKDVSGNPADEIDIFFHAVSRAARAVAAGSLLAPRLHDVILLAGPRAPWDQFRQHVVAELHGGRCRVGVGGRCQVVEEFPRSYREAELALRMRSLVRIQARLQELDVLKKEVQRLNAEAGLIFQDEEKLRERDAVQKRVDALLAELEKTAEQLD